MLDFVNPAGPEGGAFAGRGLSVRKNVRHKKIPRAPKIVPTRVKLKTSAIHKIIRSTPFVRGATIILLPRESDHLPDRWPNTARSDIPCGAPETDTLASKMWQTGTVRSGS
jgi:hypothetical protein